MNPADNPLLEIQFHVPFDRIKAEHVEPAARQLLASAREELERIASGPDPRTYENTLVELDEFTRNLDYAMNVVRHLESVATYPELRAAYNTVHPLTSEFYSNIPLHEGLWNSIKKYAETGEARGLKGTRNRYLTKTLHEFRRHGADLDAAGKTRLAEIEVELAKLTTKFAENVLDTTNAFELVITDEAKLAGLPPTALEAARQNAASKGIEGWRFTLQAPSYVPVMTYLDDRGIREHMYRAYVMRGTAEGFDNRPIIERLLELRREEAALIGFRDFADFVLEDRMAHTGDRAESFLESLKDKTVEHFRRENDDLAAFRRSLEGEEAPGLEPWDIGYYAEKQRAALYDFDEEALRPYFPLPRVVEGMFEIFGRLLGIRVTEKSGVPAWDPGVRYFEIRDAASGELLGGFYEDFYPRENKRGGAWMDALITGVQTPKGLEPHLGLICGNLTPPVGDAPALLTHREVETIFHEFGHLLHHCLSRVEMRGLAGTNVAWDFVELPSQIMENWCWECESLDLFARHYQTGEPIPGDLFQKMRRARTFRAANGQMRQLSFGLLDFALHRRYSEAEHGDVIAYSRAILQEFSPAPLPPEHAMIAGFTHLFASPVGYAAGYYSYKWAEVLDADAFTRFQNEGLFNPQTGAEYRTKILERGDSDDPMLLFRSFMGRDPDPNALLARLGLAG
ncbi:MAG TPA: M3 family metallopeptidase [Bryobacteraceae bacterium]|nr:M3 family metallopeptidase [Bryobacteraceae bacterium]